MHSEMGKGEIKVRAYSLATAFGLLLLILVSLQLLAPPTSAHVISATIEINPKTLNLMEKGVITVFIWLPGYDVNMIDVSTVRFDGVIPALRGNVEEGKMVVKFDAPSVTNYIWTSKVSHMGVIPPQADYKIPIIITGSLLTGEFFQNTQPYMLTIIMSQPHSS